MLGGRVPKSDEATLARIRVAGAGYVRYLMRARLVAEPKAFSKAQLTSWGIKRNAVERLTVLQLLEGAKRRFEELAKDIDVGDSGGIAFDEDDPQSEQKCVLVCFVPSIHYLNAAISSCHKGKPVHLEDLADWHQLDQVRRHLDTLPSVGLTPPPPTVPVTLNGPEGFPIVLGQEVSQIPRGEYDALEVLVKEYPKRLQSSTIKRILGRFHGDPGHALRRLASRGPLWRAIIRCPGPGSREGYGLVANARERYERQVRGAVSESV